MDPTWAALGALGGALAGAGLRRPVFGMSVPSGAPVRSSCPSCAAPLRGWPAPRCRNCRAWLGPVAGLEVAGAAVLALVLGRFGGRPEAAAFAFFGVLAVALAAIDIAVRRLPDPVTLPAYPVLAGLLALAASTGQAPGAFARSLLGGAALGAAFLLLALIAPGQLGLGDVKAAGLAGIALGWLGWRAVILGGCLGFVLSGLASLGLLAAGRVTLRGSIAFGPFLLAGALGVILVTRS